MRTWILMAMLALAPAIAHATNNGVGNECQGNSCGAQGGAGGNGGQGGNGGNGGVGNGGQGGAGGSSHSTNVNGNDNDNRSSATGGSASNRTDVDASSRNTNVNGQGQEQGQLQGQLQGQGQGQGQGQSTSIDFGSTKVEVAAPAGDVHGMTTGSDATICGVVGGASAQSGLVGAGVSSESFACLAHKHSLYQAEQHSQIDYVFEGFNWYFPPFMAVRQIRSAIFN